MDHEEQVGKNFAWMSVSQFVLRVLGLLFFIFISHVLGEVGLGQYSFITSFVMFWFLILDFGAGNYLYREWSKGEVSPEKLKHDFNIVFTLRLVIILVLGIPFLFFNARLNQDVFNSLVIFYIFTGIGMLLDLIDIYVKSLNLFRYIAMRQMLEKIISVLLGFTFLYLITSNVFLIFVAMLIAQCIVLFYYLSVLPFRPQFIFDYKRAIFLIKKGIPFLFLIVFASIYSRIDIVMLRYMGSYDAVGLYSVAYKFFDLSLVVVVGLLLPAVFPVLTKLYKDGTSNIADFESFFNTLLRIIISSGLLITLGIIFISPMLISFFFPLTFGASILALRILISAHILVGLSVLFNNLLVIQNNEKKGLYIVVFSALLNIVLNIILIPKYSYLGAAVATFIAEIVNVLLLQYYAEWKIPWIFVSKMGILLLGNIGVLVLMSMSNLMNNILTAIFVLTVNMFLIYVWKLLKFNDLMIFLKPFKNKLSKIRI